MIWRNYDDADNEDDGEGNSGNILLSEVSEYEQPSKRAKSLIEAVPKRVFIGRPSPNGTIEAVPKRVLIGRPSDFTKNKTTAERIQEEVRKKRGVRK